MPERKGLHGILFDMDGALYAADKVIVGAVEAAAWVRAQDIPHLFVTNTASISRAAMADKLLAFGIPTHQTKILTPATAAAEWLRTQAAADIALYVRPSASLEFADFRCLPCDVEQGASYVVVGDLGDLWNFRTPNRAFRLLYHNPEAKLVALAMTRYWLAPDGLSLDVAPFVVALEHAAVRKAFVFGKPASPFFAASVEKLGIPANQVLMIGDDIEADVAGAQAAGLKGAPVRTGKFRSSDLERAVRPDVVFDTIADLPRWWNGYCT